VTARLSTLVTALAFAAGSLTAQTHSYDWPKSISVETQRVLARLADSAHALDLPADAIVAKAAEGVLKGADDARIVRAARGLLAELIAARSALPPGAGSALLNAAASALHAGIPLSGLTKIVLAGGSNETQLAIGLVALADLSANGVRPATAGDAIVELLKRHAPEADITALRTSVARDIAAGNAPESALGERMDRLLRSLDTRKDP
jgi:hypothetical protein